VAGDHERLARARNGVGMGRPGKSHTYTLVVTFDIFYFMRLSERHMISRYDLSQTQQAPNSDSPAGSHLVSRLVRVSQGKLCVGWGMLECFHGREGWVPRHDSSLSLHHFLITFLQTIISIPFSFIFRAIIYINVSIHGLGGGVLGEVEEYIHRHLCSDFCMKGLTVLASATTAISCLSSACLLLSYH